MFRVIDKSSGEHGMSAHLRDSCKEKLKLYKEKSKLLDPTINSIKLNTTMHKTFRQ